MTSPANLFVVLKLLILVHLLIIIFSCKVVIPVLVSVRCTTVRGMASFFFFSLVHRYIVVRKVVGKPQMMD
ncbi:hypothetical protein TYRP_003451 [Tyrophagus putrescentiae]|nr:hypothetical protein TYRP_003451 [Tyrophagus putrescentiae]